MLTAGDITRLTVDEMTRLAISYREDIRALAGLPIDEFHAYLKTIPYVTDYDQCGAGECLQRPAATIQRGGDCDDKAITAAAYFVLNGVPWRYVVSATQADLLPRHVYVEFIDPVTKALTPFDATTANDRYAVARKTYKLWRYPLNYHSVASNVVTFEDGDVKLDEWAGVAVKLSELKGVKFQDVLISGIPALAAGMLGPLGVAIGAAFTWIQKLIPVRGRTRNVDYDTATKLSMDIANNVMKGLYYPLPADGRAFAAAATQRCYDAFYDKFKTWWDGVLVGIDRGRKTWLKGEEQTMQWQLHDMFFLVMRHADMTTVNDNVQQWVVKEYVEPLILLPTQKYVQDRLVELKNRERQVPAETPKPKPTTAGAPAAGTWLPWIAAAGILGALFMSKKMKGKNNGL